MAFALLLHWAVWGGLADNIACPVCRRGWEQQAPSVLSHSEVQASAMKDLVRALANNCSRELNPYQLAQYYGSPHLGTYYGPEPQERVPVSDQQSLLSSCHEVDFAQVMYSGKSNNCNALLVRCYLGALSYSQESSDLIRCHALDKNIYREKNQTKPLTIYVSFK